MIHHSDMTTVFIAGGFDLYHSAHESILRRSRALGDRLIVGINDDAHFRSKGPNRPVDTAAVRQDKLMASGLVDEVIIFSGTPLDTILRLRPTIITCGDDYTVETTVGYPECLAWNGRVVILARTPGISTTQLIDEHREDIDTGYAAYLDQEQELEYRAEETRRLQRQEDNRRYEQENPS